MTSRSHAHLGVLARLASLGPAGRAIGALDQNHDGRLDQSEIALFARTQGLDVSEATAEFIRLDADGDGMLDAHELSGVLGSGQSAMPAPMEPSEQVTFKDAPAAPAQPSAQMELTPLGKAPEAQVMAATPHAHTEHRSVSAEDAASAVVSQLSEQEHQEFQARELDHKAAELRANSTAVARSTVQEALQVSAKAAHSKAEELLKSLVEFEEQAKRAEVKAAALRAKSNAELNEAMDLMAVADAAMTGRAP